MKSFRHCAGEHGGVRTAVLVLLGLLAGAVMGYGAGYLRFGPSGQANGPEPVPVPGKGTRQSFSLARPVGDVVLIDESGRAAGQTTGVLVGTARLLVLSTSALRGAAEARLVDSRGAARTLGRVVAQLTAPPLVAVETGLVEGPSLALAEGTGALYLGREFTAIGSRGTAAGFIDSPAREDPDGTYVYAARVQRPLPWALGALASVETGHLIGLALRTSSDEASYDVVDAGVVGALLDSTASTTPAELGAYVRYYFEEVPEGQLELFAALAAAGEWERALSIGEALLDLNWYYRDRVAPRLDEAYSTLALQHAESGAPATALGLLDRASARLGASAARAIARGEILEQTGDLPGAVANLRRAVSLDPALADSAYARVRTLLAREMARADSPHSRATLAMLLEGAVADDPFHAPYHRDLGQLYFAQGRYAEALTSFSHAVQLDNSLGIDLGPSIATARQRLNTPPLTEVPVISSGSILYVHAALNGSPQRFRFILDTGASYTAISTATAAALGLTDFDRARWVTLSTANGPVNAPVVRTRSINLHGAVVQDVEVVVLGTLDRFDGLLGLSFLDHFNLDIDRSESIMRLSRR